MYRYLRGGVGGGRGPITSAIWVAGRFRVKINEATKRATSGYIRASNGVFSTRDMYKQHALMRRCGLRYKEVITERQADMWYKMCARGVSSLSRLLFASDVSYRYKYLELLSQTNPGVITIDHHATSRCFLSILPASADYNDSHTFELEMQFYRSNRQKQIYHFYIPDLFTL